MSDMLRVISQEMNAEQLIVKSPVKDFTSESQLIVYESQEAVFFKNGQALDSFGPGKHSLHTANLPLLSKIFASFFKRKDRTPFPCDIYFINKVNVLDVLWGTDTPIPLEDPRYGILVNVCANGQMGIKITDSRRFLIKIVGQVKEFTTDAVALAIKGMMISSIKEVISQAITQNNISVLEITSSLSILEDTIQQRLNQRIQEFGIQSFSFSINGIMPSPDDLQKLKEVKERRLERRIESEDIAYDMSVRNYTYQEQRQFDVLEGAAKNTGGSGGLINMGVGLGVGMGVGRTVSGMANFGSVGQQNNQPQQQAPQTPAAVCINCNSPIPPNSKFCPSCGKAVEQPKPAFCPQCGSPCQSGSKFCSSCGAKLI